jgi:aspartate kinase
MKFGGSSVANAARIKAVGTIVKKQLDKKPILVFSAMGDVTDWLLDAADNALKAGNVSVFESVEKITGIHRQACSELGLSREAWDNLSPVFEEFSSLLAGISLIKELTPKTKDYLVSFGERFSARIVAAYLNNVGVKAAALDGWDAGFITDSNFTNAQLLPETWERIPAALLPLVETGIVPVVTGFIAKNTAGNITTLGRGGSDLSATMIGASCKAVEVQVWKDVDGILTADPRLVRDARPVGEVTYDEAAELAYFGSQVLHPRAMLPCQKTGVPVLVKNSYNPDAPGTRIAAVASLGENPVRTITTKKNVTLVDVISTRMLGQYGFMREVFSIFERHKTSVDVVATSEVSISATLDNDADLEGLKHDLASIADVEVKTGKAIVTLIGDVRRSSEILAGAFSVCAETGVNVEMVSQGASKVNISFIISSGQASTVVKALHEKFFA